MSSDSRDLVDGLGPVVQRYQAAVDDFDREVARLLGVNATDLRCLECLLDAEDGGLTPRDLADALALTTGSVTTMLDRLERAGYVVREPHPHDGRRLLVRVRPEARDRIWDLIGPHIAESASAVSAGFDAEQLAVVRRFLETVTTVQRTHVARLREGR